MWVMTCQAGCHFPSATLAANRAVASTHTQLVALRRVDVAPAVDRRRLFFVLIPATVGQSLCGEGRAIRPHYCQLTLGLLEICASTERSIIPSLHRVQALKNHLRLICRSTILAHIGTRFLGGRLIRGSDLYVSIYGSFDDYNRLTRDGQVNAVDCRLESTHSQV